MNKLYLKKKMKERNTNLPIFYKYLKKLIILYHITITIYLKYYTNKLYTNNNFAINIYLNYLIKLLWTTTIINNKYLKLFN